MAWWPAIATVAASLISSQGQEKTNDRNQEIQQQNSAFNAEQAELNRQFSHNEAGLQQAFQQQMANTTWQRGVRDMQAAGLNPMLAYSQGGAPSPSGAMGQGSAAQAGSPGNAVNPYAAAAASAGQWAQIEKTQADTRLTTAQAEELESTLVDEQGNTKHGKGPGWNSLKAAQMNAYTGQIGAATRHLDAQVDLTKEQKKLVTEQIKNALAENPRIDSQTALNKINAILARHDIPRMEAESKYFKTPVGRESPHNKYGPQTPFRLLEGLGERVINRWGASTPNYSTPSTGSTYHPSGRIR